MGRLGHRMTMRVLAISGSLRAQSTNTTLLRAVAMLSPCEIEVELFQELDQIPPFNSDLEERYASGPVGRFREVIRRHDAVVFSTPEYAHGIPGALKNALDWIVGSGELSGKPVALMNASSRGVYAVAALKEVLATMDARLLHEAEVTVHLLGKEMTAEEIALDPEAARMLSASLELLAELCGCGRSGQPQGSQAGV